MMLSGTALCQNYTLPSVLFDSMTFEVFKGRSCDSVKRHQANEIEKLGVELVAKGTALRLSQKGSIQLDSLLSNSKRGQEILTMQFDKDISKEKRKVKKWRGIAIIETLGIVGLLLLL